MLNIEDTDNVVIIWQKPEQPTGAFNLTRLAKRNEHPQYLIERIISVDMPYKVCNVEDLPENILSEMEFYDFDFSNPDGYGSGSYINNSGEEIVGYTGSYQEWKEMYNV